MRGTLVLLIFAAISTGIIPAYAGNTNSGFIDFKLAGDHPRVCGEHLEDVLSNYDDPGSSPRMRGTHAQSIQEHHIVGIIPAYAGNTGAFP